MNTMTLFFNNPNSKVSGTDRDNVEGRQMNGG